MVGKYLIAGTLSAVLAGADDGVLKPAARLSLRLQRHSILVVS